MIAVTSSSFDHLGFQQLLDRPRAKPPAFAWLPMSLVAGKRHRWQVERKRRIVSHGGCGAGLIREATPGNTSLLCESGTFCNRSLRNSYAGA
jgi:hypothetical protein